MNGDLQAYRPANSPSFQDGRILHVHLFHDFAVIILRKDRRQAKQH
jgi:hypothetical protein